MANEPDAPEPSAHDIGRPAAPLPAAGEWQVEVEVPLAEADPAVARTTVADPVTSQAVREATGVNLAAVLLVPALPTDVRHNSKIDRVRVAAWAERVLAGDRAGRLA